MSSTMPPIGGRYELRRQLASGPAARVYLAQDLQLGRPVALKVLGPDLARDPAIVDRFRQAASTAASVHDPRIVTIYDWGDDQGAVYVAMELVEGSSLAETVETARRLGVDQTVSLGIGVAQALDAAHRAGLVHGSLTPRDVLLARDGSVKVTDFGTATAGLAALGDQLDIATYAAPEQLQGAAPDARSDLYALGGVLYVAATGSPPFAAPDAVALTQRKLAEHPMPPSASTPGIPPGFDAVVERLLDRDPGRRYASAIDAAAELRRLQETIQVPLAAATTAMPTMAAAPLGGPPEPPPERKRSATGWIVAAIIILALAVGGLVLWAVLQDDDGADEDVSVPAVVGLALPDAQADLQAVGLDSSTVNENNDEVPPGTVFQQAPQPTTRVRRGTVVVLKVSAGPTTTTTSSTTTSSTTTTTSTTSTTTTTTQPPTTSSTGP
jgi:serine/threonine-protein kinase